MAFVLKNIIFGLFGVNAKVNDVHKDINGKGINERYNEAIAEDYDEEIETKIDGYFDNLIIPQTAQEKFLYSIERNIGIPVQLSDLEAFRRRMIILNNAITLTKGTEKSYLLLFNLIGVTGMVVTVPDKIFGLDSITTLDSDTRRFDGRKFCCFHFSLDLTGTATHNAELEKQILTIVNYLRPINSEIDAITYNATPIPLP